MTVHSAEAVKRKSPSQGLSRVLCPSTLPSPPSLCPMRQITASPPSECRGISNGFFGQALTFAARLMQHTVNQLQQWAKEPNLGVKSFASSILLMSRSICLPYQGMVLDRMSNPCKGFVFRAESCSGICSGQRFSNVLRCSFCVLQKKVGSEKIRQLIKPSTGCVGKRATILNISMNPAMVAMEIKMAWEEIRHLRHELARTVLQKAIDKDGAVLLDGATGNQIRWATGIMDGSITKAFAWFSRWKELHDKRVREKHATEYIFFADETWFCIKLLLLGHITVMHIYCVI
jgi:hypothetical protein